MPRAEVVPGDEVDAALERLVELAEPVRHVHLLGEDLRRRDDPPLGVRHLLQPPQDLPRDVRLTLRGVHLRGEPVAVILVGAVLAQLTDELVGPREVAVLDEERREVLPRPPAVGVARLDPPRPVEVGQRTVVVAQLTPRAGALDERRDEVVALDAGRLELGQRRTRAGLAPLGPIARGARRGLLVDDRPDADDLGTRAQRAQRPTRLHRLEVLLQGADEVGALGAVDPLAPARPGAQAATGADVDRQRVGLADHVLGQIEQAAQVADVDAESLVRLDDEHPRRVGHRGRRVAGRGDVAVPLPDLDLGAGVAGEGQGLLGCPDAVDAQVREQGAELAHRLQTAVQVPRLIGDDEAHGDARGSHACPIGLARRVLRGEFRLI